ncbi:alpha/beta hydrolase [Corynebacterium cystitidis]|uniref:alpha/beta hydrolase n=1 Tax=Corynebacterium cystitidis TaxID=35757 RepID=UPI00211E889B|nr:alpha/beta hydrolase [Corynebacterium cystitidis]
MTPPPRLEPGDPNDNYPLNEQGTDHFNVGGVRRTLPDNKQMEQLVSYLHATYPEPGFTPPWKGGSGDPGPADRYSALLPDRITHAAMLMLGSAVDHTMPGVAFSEGVEVTEVASISAAQFTPSEPTGRWAISLHPGGWWRGAGDALEYAWRPEVAAAAQLSGTTILDVDYPLAPAHTVKEIRAAVVRAIDYARSRAEGPVAAWGYSAGGALATLVASQVDALVLTFPDLDLEASLNDDLRDGFSVPAVEQWPSTFVQVAVEDEVAAPPDVGDAAHVTVAEYYSTHKIATPAVNRARIQDVAAFLRGF